MDLPRTERWCAIGFPVHPPLVGAVVVPIVTYVFSGGNRLRRDIPFSGKNRVVVSPV